MALLPILEVPDPRLRQKAAPVPVVDERVRALLNDMLETMYAAPGIGLAAPQVGVAQRMIVVDVGPKEEPKPIRLINPEVLSLSEEQAEAEEGCLSLPNQFAPVNRAASVKVRYMDELGQDQEIEAEGLLARCLQHEIDHLDGVLFTDRLSRLKREMLLKKLEKQRRQRAG
ncbi:MAG TPA: peptide deformylase [Geminicoccus sp.]|jgi:peptide deformylase|uniref:peptide deformylase n=1 Tax=Geminicoccus sp. TaxID=2024832 RepID=UPI002E310D7A|nr:peptide deformylase [Geminicoccus sp.]HEX2525080.1 peptide deformylase [Geminicoccus sp.]